MVISALVLAWQHASEMTANTLIDADGSKVYDLRGTLFFVSTRHFQNLFTPAQDPAQVIVEFAHARVMDHSAIETIDTLAERYQKLGKRLRLRHLSPDCAELLRKAGSMVEWNAQEDPHYHLADDRLG